MKFKFYVDFFRGINEWSVRELSKRSGVSRSYIQLLEKNDSGVNPTIATMQKLADVFKTEPGELFRKIDD